MNPRLRRFLRLLSDFFQIFEDYLFHLWECIPLRWRQNITFLGWSIYFPLHRYFLGHRTGIHRDASLEFHALTTLLYWGRLFPVTIRRMRFSLSQLHVWHPPSAFPVSRPLTQIDSSRSSVCSTRLSETDYSLNSVGNNCESTHSEVLGPKSTCCECCFREKCKIDGVWSNVFHVRHDMVGLKLKLSDRVYSKDDGLVTGFYLQHGNEPSDTVVFWLYGGAFLSGDSIGNTNIGK